MNQYKIKSAKKKFVGFMTLTYAEGCLIRWERSKLCKLTPEQQQAFGALWPWLETDLEKLASKGLLIESVVRHQEQLSSEKLLIWCRVYNKKYPEAKYKVRTREAAILSQVEVTEELIKAYLDSDAWWSKPKSIANYVKRNNELRNHIATGNKPKSQFPNAWSKEIERKYDGATLQAYWAHLRSLGLQPKKHPTTKQTIAWE